MEPHTTFIPKNGAHRSGQKAASRFTPVNRNHSHRRTPAKGGSLLGAVACLLLLLAAAASALSTPSSTTPNTPRSRRRSKRSDSTPARSFFALLALSLARRGQPATVERILNIACALGSMMMNLLAADLTSPRSVTVWVMPSVLYAFAVANAAEHGDGTPIDVTIGRQHGPNGEPGVLCQVTDAAPALPQPRAVSPDSERGRGLHVVAALATDSGMTKNPRGKTAWFTLNATQEPTRDNLEADHISRSRSAASARNSMFSLARSSGTARHSAMSTN